MLPLSLRRLWASLVTLCLLVLPAGATWSIVTINLKTGEVGVASATCLENFNLRNATPVIVIGKGAAAAQSFIDQSGANRRIVWNAFQGGTLTPDEILAALAAADAQHETRQYGIVSFTGAPATFTGTGAGAAASGVAGQVGDYVYAVQGNVLTGDVVVTAAEQAFRATNGDMGQRLMAAMQAARDFGGDGRCSCSVNNPTFCGAPPPNFEKSAHCGFLIVARHGDTNGICNRLRGCATGEYYILMNIAGANSAASAPDPVDQLQQRYDSWRARHVGTPDGILSSVDPIPALPADGRTQRTVTVTLRDLDGNRLTTGGATVEVTTRNGQPSLATVGAVVDHGDGTYSFPLTAGTTPGTDRFVITADDGTEKATLYPFLDVKSDPVAPLHAGFESLSATAGGDVPLVVNVPPRARARYLVLGSLSGTQPGVQIGKLTFPLNPDALTLATRVHAGDPDHLPGTVGFLDADGHAQGAFVAAAGELLPLAGLRVDFAALVVGRGTPLATNAVGFDVLP